MVETSFRPAAAGRHESSAPRYEKSGRRSGAAYKRFATSHADRRKSSAGNRGDDRDRPWHRPHAVHRVAHPPIATAARKARRRLRGDDSRIRAQPADVLNRGDRVLRIPRSDRHRCAGPFVAGLRSQPVDCPGVADSVARGFHRRRRGVFPSPMSRSEAAPSRGTRHGEATCRSPGKRSSRWSTARSTDGMCFGVRGAGFASPATSAG